MTAKRDLKRHVRARQARTGEAYVTALRHVLGERDAADDADAAAEPQDAGGGGGESVPVVEMIDVSDVARGVDIRCRTVMFPELRARLDPRDALVKLRAVLEATRSDAAFDVLRRVLLQGESRAVELTAGALDDARRFIDRARAGVGGLGPDGTRLALDVGGQLVLFILWLRPTTSYLHIPPMLLVAGTDDVARAVLTWDVPGGTLVRSRP
jgi:hypothetical protein